MDLDILRVKYVNKCESATYVTLKTLLHEGANGMKPQVTETVTICSMLKGTVKFVEFVKDTCKLDVLSGLSQGTATSNSCIDMVFGRNVDNLSWMNYVSYFSCHRPILSRTNHQDSQLTDVTKN
jgi:hypothetical protein